ncbi:MAG: Rab family GTPase [Thermoplasmata archaeon]
MRTVRKPRLYPKIARTHVKLCMVGDRGVGKTALIRKYVLNDYDNRYFQTVGTRVYRKRVGVRIAEYRMNVVADLEIWDITGDKGLASILKEAYFYGAQGVIAICDMSRRETLYDLDYWMDSALQVAKGARMEIAVNKSDVPRKQIHPRDVDLVARAYECPYLFVSARSGENTEALYAALIISILRRKLARRPRAPVPSAM